MNLDPIWLILAGFGGGLSGSVAGLASLVSYPALLAVGCPPIAANVSNTVALVFGGAGSLSGSRVELSGQWRFARDVGAAAAAGGVVGATLLLATPTRAFSLLVPWLIGGASLGVLLRRTPTRSTPHPSGRPSRILTGAVGGICIYGGYFGAASGVLMLTLLLQMTEESLARANAMKNVLLGVANVVAALVFIAFGPVRWTDVFPLAVGFFLGGRTGPSIVRWSPPGVLRGVIALAGIGVAVHLGLDAYR